MFALILCKIAFLWEGLLGIVLHCLFFLCGSYIYNLRVYSWSFNGMVVITMVISLNGHLTDISIFRLYSQHYIDWKVISSTYCFLWLKYSLCGKCLTASAQNLNYHLQILFKQFHPALKQQSIFPQLTGLSIVSVPYLMLITSFFNNLFLPCD